MKRSRRTPRIEAFASGLGEDDFHAVVIKIMIYRACGVAPAAYTGYEVVRIIAALVSHQLRLDFLTDDRLQPGHQVGIRMRPHRRAYHIVRIVRMTAPVADSLVRGVFQRHIA